MNAHQLKCFMLNIFSDGQSASCVPSQGPPPHSAQVWQLSDRRLAPRNADDGPRVFTVTLKLLLEHTPGTEARHTGSSTAPQNERMRPEWRERELTPRGEARSHISQLSGERTQFSVESESLHAAGALQSASTVRAERNSCTL